MKDYSKLYIYDEYMFLPDFLSFCMDIFGVNIQSDDNTFFNPNIVIKNFLYNISIEKYIDNRDEPPSPAILYLIKQSLSSIKTPQLLGIMINDNWNRYSG